MKKLKTNFLPASSFLLALFVLFLIGIRPFLVSVYVGTDYLHRFDSSVFQEAEKEFNDSLPTRYIFLDANSVLCRITGQRMIDKDIFKLDNGKLVYTVPEEDMTPYADQLIRFADYMKNEARKPLLYVQLPFEIDCKNPLLPDGAVDYSHENADSFLEKIEAAGVQTFDLRKPLEQEPDYYDLFFRTDHHWKTETGFKAFQLLNDYLTRQDASYAVDSRIKDWNRYRTESYNNFLGSAGRKTGPAFSGYDELTAIYPKFKLDLSAYDVKGDCVRKGDATDTVLFEKNLFYDNHYLCNMYSFYMGGDADYVRYVNTSDGIHVTPKKILYIKDSFSLTILPYMIYGYQDITVVDLRYLTEKSLTDIVREENPDLTIIAYNPGALSESNEKMFRFLK